jgi:hypothetical protein
MAVGFNSPRRQRARPCRSRADERRLGMVFARHHALRHSGFDPLQILLRSSQSARDGGPVRYETFAVVGTEQPGIVDPRALSCIDTCCATLCRSL